MRSEIRGDSGGSSSSSSGWSSSSSSSGWSWSDDDDDDHDYAQYDDWDDDDHEDASNDAPPWSAGSHAMCCVDDDSPLDGTVPRYTRYPYATSDDGYVERVPEAEQDERGRMFAGRVTLEGGYMGDRVWRSGFALRLSFWRFGLDNELHFYLEQPLRDALYLGSSNLTFDFLMREALQWRIGGGMNYMIDGRTPGEGHREYAAGTNFTTSFDAFPIRPVVFSGRFDYGTLYKAPVFTGRATLGVTFSGFEIVLGYEGKAIGNVKMHGPITGLRLWF